MEEKVVKIKKKIRSENWIQQDKELLMQLVRQRYAAIENKNTDHISNYEKKKAWQDLEQHFNNLCEGAHRNIRHLKTQWTTIKMLNKKSATSKRTMSDVSEESRREISEASQDMKSLTGVEPDEVEEVKFKTNDTTSQGNKTEKTDNVIQVKIESCIPNEEFFNESSQANEQSAKDERIFGAESFGSIDGLAVNSQTNENSSKSERAFGPEVFGGMDGRAVNNLLTAGTVQTAENTEESRDSFNESEISLKKVKRSTKKSDADIPQKRKRSDNWLESDKTLLKELVRSRLNIIEYKKTDTLTNHKKKKAWAHVETCFNSLCQGEKRKVHQLKSQWTLQKILARKEAQDRGINSISACLFKYQEPGLNDEINKPKLLADLQFQNCMELHALQVENERKKGRNLDLEYEILLEKKKFYKTKFNGTD